MIGPVNERIAMWWAHRRGRRWGPTMRLATGGKIHVLDPRAEDIHVADIARGLANECRYAGQTRLDLDADQIFYSVAEHSVIISLCVAELAPNPALALAWAREGLMHDGSEAYLGDMIRPIKYLPQMRWYRRAEDRLQRAINTRFGIVSTSDSRAAIKQLDTAILVDESCVREGIDVQVYAKRYGGPLGVRIEALPPADAEALWVHRFAQLWPEEVAAAARSAQGWT